MSEMLYLQTERNIKITSPVVTLGDVAQLSCSDGAVLARNQVRRVAHLPDDGYGRYVCSASTLVRLVTEAEEHVDVTHIGEPNFILTYEDPRQKNRIRQPIRTWHLLSAWQQDLTVSNRKSFRRPKWLK